MIRWPQVLALAACLALLVGLSVWFFGPTMGEPMLAWIQGVDVSIERGTEFVPAANGMRLQSADVLRTGTNANVAVTFGKENTRIDLRAGTELKLASWSRGKRFELREGKIEASVARQRWFHPMIVRTAQAEARVLGTKFTLTASTNATRLEVAEGKVQLARASDGAAVKVTTGHYAVAAAKTELAALSSTGRILREVWTNYPGAFIAIMTSDPVVSERPNDWEMLTGFETPTRPASRFGQRVRGYVHPSITGDYRFSIDVAGLGEALLFLSLDDRPENRTQIHFDETRPNLALSDRVAESAWVTLVAGHKYYIEALHESVTGTGQFKVSWQGPGRKREVIPGEFLSPPDSKKKGKKR